MKYRSSARKVCCPWDPMEQSGELWCIEFPKRPSSFVAQGRTWGGPHFPRAHWKGQGTLSKFLSFSGWWTKSQVLHFFFFFLSSTTWLNTWNIISALLVFVRRMDGLGIKQDDVWKRWRRCRVKSMGLEPDCLVSSSDYPIYWLCDFEQII